METIGEVLGSVADWFLDAFGTMLERLASDPSYRAGFGAGFLIIIVLAVCSSAISWAWGRVQKFFSSTKAPPAPGAGPTPAGLTGGCVLGALVLFLLVLVALYLLSRLVVA